MTTEHEDLRASLAVVFGKEWANLSASDQSLIVRDCTEDGGVDDLGVYRSNIGRRQLAIVRQSYARTISKGQVNDGYARRNPRAF